MVHLTLTPLPLLYNPLDLPMKKWHCNTRNKNNLSYTIIHLSRPVLKSLGPCCTVYNLNVNWILSSEGMHTLNSKVVLDIHQKQLARLQLQKTRPADRQNTIFWSFYQRKYRCQSHEAPFAMACSSDALTLNSVAVFSCLSPTHMCWRLHVQKFVSFFHRILTWLNEM